MAKENKKCERTKKENEEEERERKTTIEKEHKGKKKGYKKVSEKWKLNESE